MASGAGLGVESGLGTITSEAARTVTSGRVTFTSTLRLMPLRSFASGSNRTT